MRNKWWLVLLAIGILALSLQPALGDRIQVEDADAVWDLSLSTASTETAATDNESVGEDNASLYTLATAHATGMSTMLGDNIIVDNASAVWNLTLDNATEVGRLIGEPGVFVTKYADTFSYFLLENATAIGRLIGEPGVMVTKYADTFSYFLLENATAIGRLIGEPGVMVTKYADTFVYFPLVGPEQVLYLVGEPGVMVTRYADTFTYAGLEVPPFIPQNVTEPIIANVAVTNVTLTSATVTWDTDEPADSLVKYGTESGNHTLQAYDPANVTSHGVDLTGLLANTTYYFVVNSTTMNGSSNQSAEYTFSTTLEAEYFDTGEGAYPSIHGTHKGTIRPSSDITITTLYTYACPGTGGHSGSVQLYENGALLASGVWTGYGSDWQNITLTSPISLQTGHTYNYTIVTGSYPQIIHAQSKVVTGGTITCEEFVDANGQKHEGRIPAIKLWSD